MHGDSPVLPTAERALAEFVDEEVDLIVFGHSHRPLRKRDGDVLLFNPGSPTDRRTEPRFSYGRLALGEDGRLTGRARLDRPPLRARVESCSFDVAGEERRATLLTASTGHVSSVASTTNGARASPRLTANASASRPRAPEGRLRELVLAERADPERLVGHRRLAADDATEELADDDLAPGAGSQTE